MARKTKAEEAAAHVSAATNLFTDAHARLSTAADLLQQAENEHAAEAARHTAAAEGAKADRERAERVRDRLAQLVS